MTKIALLCHNCHTINVMNNPQFPQFSNPRKREQSRQVSKISLHTSLHHRNVLQSVASFPSFLGTHTPLSLSVQRFVLFCCRLLFGFSSASSACARCQPFWLCNYPKRETVLFAMCKSLTASRLPRPFLPCVPVYVCKCIRMHY